MNRPRHILSIVLVLTAVGLVVPAWLVDHESTPIDTVARTQPPTPMAAAPPSGPLTGEQHGDLAGAHEAFKQQRRDYFEQLHETAPGIDWRAMDRATRARLARERTAARCALLAAGRDPGQAPVILEGTDDILGTWTEKGSNNLSGRMHTATVYDGMIYAGSSGGTVWRGTLAGTDWTPLNDWYRMPGIVTVEVLPGVGAGDHRILVVHNGDGRVHYSDDDGQSWLPATGLTVTNDGYSTKRADVMGDTGQTVFLVQEEWHPDESHNAAGLYRSVDHGQSFQRVALLNRYVSEVDLWCPDDAAGPGYLVNRDEIYRFDVAGTLTRVGTLPLLHDPDIPYRMFLRGRSAVSGADLFVIRRREIYSAVSGGTICAHRGTAPNNPFMVNSFVVSQNNEDELYIGGVEASRSADGGATWSIVNEWEEYYDSPQTKLHADIPGIHVFDGISGEFVLVCTDGGIYISHDGLQTEDNISLSGMRISQYYDVLTHPTQTNVVYAGSQDQGFQRSLNDPGGLMDFEQTYLGDFAHLVSGDGGQSVWSVCPLFVMYYPDAVNSTETQIWDYPPMQKLWLPPLMADPTHAGVCWLGGDHLVRLQSTLGTITAEEQTYDFGGPIAALACAPLDTDYWYVRDREGGFFYSFDSGASWTRSAMHINTEAFMRSGTSIVASPTTLGTVWIAGSGYSVPPVWVSHDHGATFTDFSTGLPSTLVYMMDVSDDGRWLFAGAEVGPYVRDLEGGDWQYAGGVTAPDQVYWCVEWVEALQTARFGTYGRGIWDFTLGSGSPEEEDVPLATGFGLRAAPNPFNAATTISFDLPRNAQVAIDLYDVRGAHMTQIFTGPLTAGSHEQALRADRLPSSIYMVRLQVDGAQETLRVSLVK